MKKITRRNLAAAVFGSAAAATAAAQAQPPSGTPEEELKAARDRLHGSLDVVSALQIPMAVEPAFQFKA